MRHILTIILSLFFIQHIAGQTRELYYGSDYGPVQDVNVAAYKKTLKGNPDKRIQVITMKKSGEDWQILKKENMKRVVHDAYRIKYSGENIIPRTVYRTFQPVENDRYIFTDWLKGKIVQTGYSTSIVPLHLTDTVWTYYEDEKLKSISIYQDNQLISNKNWLRNGNEYIDNIYYYVDETPEHEMGQVNFRNYIISGIKNAGIDISQLADQVVINWVVMEDGSSAGFHATAGRYSNLRSTLISLLEEMPGHWVPATLHGSPVRYFMSIPFNFIDQSENFESLDLSSGFLVWD